jgi:hypothetical protein
MPRDQVTDVDARRAARYFSTDPSAAEDTSAIGDTVAGMLPGVGWAQALRDYKRADKAKDKLGKGIAAGGALLATVPIIGKPVAKAGGAIAREVASEIPAALRALGVAKKAREAATAGRLTAQTGRIVERQAGAGTRAKVAPDVYRKLYETGGTDAVLDAAKAGEHLKPQAGGGFAGAPRTVGTTGELGGMRRALDKQLSGGAEALHYADPERTGNWYDRAKGAQAISNEPWQLPRSLEQHGVYSAGVAPENELAFALKHRNQEALGTGETAYRGAGKRTLDRAVAADQPAKLAPKIGEYSQKNNPMRVETSPFGVNDFRMAQSFGYTDPTGAPWKAGATETMHPFMDAETALMVDRANKRGVGGRTDWTGAKAQEIPWVLNKAEDIYGRGKAGRFNLGGEDNLEGKIAALREANNTIGDYMPKHTFSATHEAIPGANTGHVPQALDMPYEWKQQYGDQAPWTRAGDTLETAHGNVGEGDRDVLYSALGFRQLPAERSVGNYTNSLGNLEQNPMTISRPLVDFATGTAQSINPNTQKALEATELFRGVNDAQEAVAGNLPVTMAGRKGKEGLLIEGAIPDRERMTALTEALRGTPYEGNMSATNRGALLFPSGAKAQRQMLKQADEILPGEKISKAASEGFYLPAMSSKAEAGQGIATTRALEAMAAAPESVALNVGESEGVRSAIRAKAERDAKMGGARPDIQKMRSFFSEADWPQAVAMMRKGMKPAAALAAMGYSLEGMADENQP